MKEIIKKIPIFQENLFFIPLRDKVDYARLVAYTARLLLLNYENIGKGSNFRMKLIVDKMSRMFYYRDHKYFSVSFPFNILIEEEQVKEITTYSGKKVDNYSVSAIISIIDNEKFKLNPSPVDFWIDTNSVDSNAISLLEEILQFEPAYIRYDNDLKNENGKRHPLYHLDINYTSYGSYKLGLNDVIIEDYFENILNITTDCLFITE